MRAQTDLGEMPKTPHKNRKLSLKLKILPVSGGLKQHTGKAAHAKPRKKTPAQGMDFSLAPFSDPPTVATPVNVMQYSPSLQIFNFVEKCPPMWGTCFS